MQWARFYTLSGCDVFEGARFRTVSDEQWREYVVPQHWNQAAVDILLEKVFYPRPLPALTQKVEEAGVPSWLWRSEADHTGLDSISAEWRYRTEKDIREVLHRVVGALTYRAWKNGVFSSTGDAQIFYDELRYIFLHQIASPELNQWISLGLDWAYGLTDAAPFTPRHRVAAFDTEAPQALRRAKILADTLALDGGRARVTLPVESADSAGFMSWKKNADIRVVAEQLGRRALETGMHHVMDACDRDSFFGFNPERHPQLRQAVAEARGAGLPEAAIRTAISYTEQGYEEIPLTIPEDEMPAEQAIKTALSVPDDFIEAALTGHSFLQHPAPELWNALSEAVWASGEPAVSFRNSIEAANITGKPLSCDTTGGFIFVAGREAPSAVINVLTCSVEAIPYVARLMTVALDAVSRDAEYRPIVLGMTNIAAVLMSRGIAYDSEAGRVTAALLAALVSGSAYQASAEMAAAAGAYVAYPAGAKAYLQNIKDKIAALAGAAFLQKGMTRRPVQLRTALCADLALTEATKQAWEKAYQLGRETGFRHAHLTGIDTEPAVQVLLGVQTPDIAPESALARFEGYFSEVLEGMPLYGKKLNPMVPCALTALGYTAAERENIHFYVVGHGTLLDAPHINHQALREKGFHQAALDALESALSTALHIRYAFNKWTLGGDFCCRVLGFPAEEMESVAFDMLPALGFTEDQIEAANIYCCGTMTLEGAPHLKPAHLAVFDCIAPVSSFSVRRVSPGAQVEMQAAVERFLSGGVAHTVILGYHATIDDVQKLILKGWELGVKNLMAYREGCSLLHPVVQAFNPAEITKEEEPMLCPKQSMTA